MAEELLGVEGALHRLLATPNSSFGYRSRGLVFDAMGKTREAIEDFSRAITLSPTDAGLLIERGKVLAKSGRDRQAITDFTGALSIDQSAYAP